jgi:ribosomal protein S18 acetylase RimI-like enzyme
VTLDIRRLRAAEIRDSLGELSELLIDCVEGGASISFMLPMTRAKADAFWRGVADGVERGDRVLIVAVDDRIVGAVQLVAGQPENQPHRADVSKLLVHRRARRRGIAQTLMAAVEAVAREEQKTVLVLDTATGSDAERLYARMGWERVGVIPDYAKMPDGPLTPTTIFFKRV